MFFRMIYKSGQIFLPFCHNSRVWWTDGQTDRQTDRRTDRIFIARPRLQYMQRCKNWTNYTEKKNCYTVYTCDNVMLPVL